MSTQSTSQVPYPRADVDPPSGSLFPHKHLLGIRDLDPTAIKYLLDTADTYAEQNRSAKKSSRICAGITHIN